MAHFERNLESETACEGLNGTYEAVVHYIQFGQLRRPEQIDFGRRQPDVDEPADLLVDIAARLGDQIRYRKNDGEFPVDKIAAVGLMRVCQRTEHDDGAYRREGGTRLEYVSSLAVVRSVAEAFPLRTLAGSEKIVSPNGLGHARRMHGGPKINTLIHLPVAPASLEEGYEVRAAIPSNARANSRSEQPHIALHTQLGGEPLERIIPFEQIG